MPSRHVNKVASRLKFLIGNILQRELDDPRLGFVTVLDVEPTADFKEAKVYFSVLGSRGDRSKTLHALQDASGFIQKQIGKNLRLRNTPVLRFILEEEEARMARIEELLEETRSGDGEEKP